jgi:hypothetical protein
MIASVINSSCLKDYFKADKGKFFPVHTMKACSGRRDITPLTLNIGIRWRSAVNFMLEPIYARGKNPITHRIGVWVPPRDGLDIYKKNSSPRLGFKTWTSQSQYLLCLLFLPF